MKLKFEFKGDDEFIRRLHEQPIKVHRKTINLIRKIADDFEEDFQRRAPRGKTGSLRDSGYATVDEDELSVEMGADAAIANYGVYVEYGTRRMEARPFFRPARATALQTFQKGMEDISKKGGD